MSLDSFEDYSTSLFQLFDSFILARDASQTAVVSALKLFKSLIDESSKCESEHTDLVSSFFRLAFKHWLLVGLSPCYHGGVCTRSSRQPNTFDILNCTQCDTEYSFLHPDHRFDFGNSVPSGYNSIYSKTIEQDALDDSSCQQLADAEPSKRYGWTAETLVEYVGVLVHSTQFFQLRNS